MQHNELVARLLQLEEQVRQWRAERDDDTFRRDMAADGKIDEQPISREMAIQIVNSFYQNYDKQARQNIEDIRARDPEHNRELLAKYDKELAQVQELKARFSL